MLKQQMQKATLEEEQKLLILQRRRYWGFVALLAVALLAIFFASAEAEAVAQARAAAEAEAAAQAKAAAEAEAAAETESLFMWYLRMYCTVLLHFFCCQSAACIRVFAILSTYNSLVTTAARVIARRTRISIDRQPFAASSKSHSKHARELSAQHQQLLASQQAHCKCVGACESKLEHQQLARLSLLSQLKSGPNQPETRNPQSTTARR